MQIAEERVSGHPYIEALVIAILLGMAVRTVWEPGRRWRAGIAFSAKQLLEVAVMLLGASISLAAIVASGPLLLAAIVGTVIVTIAASFGISRLLGLPVRLSILIACGNSICGNSAIAAVAPVIGADGEDIASSIAFTAILGVLMVLGLPLLIPLLGFSARQYGILAGLTVYAVPQVLAATVPAGLVSTQVGTLVKLVRVLMLGPVVFALSLLGRRCAAAARMRGDGPACSSCCPGSSSASSGSRRCARPASCRTPSSRPRPSSPALLTVVSMAALGLGVDVRVIGRVGGRVTAAVTLSLALLLALSIGLILGLGLR